MDFDRIMTAQAHPSKLIVGKVLDHLQQAGIGAKQVLAEVRAALDKIFLVLPVADFAQPFDQKAVAIVLDKAVPIRAPDALDHVPACATEDRFQFLNDFSVAAHRAIETLQVAVHDENQIVESFARSPFSGTVRDCISRLSNGRSTIFYTRPAAGDQPGSQYDVVGHVDIGLLKTMGMPLSATFYVCGPSGFMSAVTSGLKAQDVPSASIRTELFGPATVINGETKLSPHLPFGQPGAGPTVNFVRSGLSVAWSEAYRSLLELAEASNVPVRWSCRAGVCHNCETSILSGKLEYRTVPIDPPPEGVALVCCSTPLSNVDLDI